MLYLMLNLSLNACAPIIIYFGGRGINHDILILISAITAVFAFHGINAGKNKQAYLQVIKSTKIRSGIAKVILTTTFMWVGGFIIPIMYTPFIFVFTYLGLPGLIGAIVLAINTQKPLYILQACLIGLLFSVFYMQMFNTYPLLKAIIGVVVTMSTGVSLYLYLRYSHKLNHLGISSKQILALRYWLLLLLPLMIVLSRHELGLITLSVGIKCVAIGMGSLVLPLYFGQLCIEKFGSEKYSLLMGFTPLLTFLFQYILIKAELNQIVIALLLGLAIATPYLIHQILKLKTFKQKKVKLCVNLFT